MLEDFVDRFLDMADEREKRGKAAGEKIGEKIGEKRGVAQGISQVAINMIKQKYEKEEIKKCTGLSYEKIKKLEKSLQNA